MAVFEPHSLNTGPLKCARHRRSAAAGQVYVRQSAAAAGITAGNHWRRTWCGFRRTVGWRIIAVQVITVERGQGRNTIVLETCFLKRAGAANERLVG
jgi:hypothetical protein